MVILASLVGVGVVVVGFDFGSVEVRRRPSAVAIVVSFPTTRVGCFVVAVLLHGTIKFIPIG